MPPVVAVPLPGGAPPLSPGSDGGPPANVGTNASTPVLSIYLPEVFPIPAAFEFQQFGQLNTAVAGVSFFPTAALQLPPHYQGIIRTVNIFVGGAGGTTFTTDQLWTIYINGAPVPGWVNRTLFGRTASSLEQAFDAFIRIPDGSVVTASNNNVDGGSYTVGIWFTGWYWPVVGGQQWVAGLGSYAGI
jgi:hypothetical protein